VGPRARLKADVFARAVTIAGYASGTITASERIDIETDATIENKIITPQVVLIEGAYFKGRVDPNRADAAVRVAQYRIDHKQD
jgi:cytoskeletal protein CcmA (bactofilin family)